MQEIETVSNAILGENGRASRELRTRVEAYAARLSGIGNEADIPDDLKNWVEKVALHAYKTTEEDVERLKSSGYSEDEIFEITIAAAHGASRARLDLALRAVEEEEEADDEA
jgi:hypothetical protein